LCRQNYSSLFLFLKKKKKRKKKTLCIYYLSPHESIPDAVFLGVNKHQRKKGENINNRKKRKVVGVVMAACVG